VLDLRAIRADPDAAREALRRRGDGSAERLDTALELDQRRRAILPELEQLRAQKNTASKRIGELKRADEDASAAIEEVGGLSAREKQFGEELASVEAELEAVLAALPNIPDPAAPPEDTVLREVGEAGRSISSSSAR
jgi:seryl-tRNA synthetase